MAKCKKIAITGSASGIGKATKEHFSNLGWNILEFNRGNGDITDPKTVVQIVLKETPDVFFNNAFDGKVRHAQIDLLYALIEAKKKKKIVSTGSNSSDGNKRRVHPYAAYKASLEKANAQLFDLGYDVSLLKPGLVDTPRVNRKKIYEEKVKMDPKWVAETVEWIITRPFVVKDITFLPVDKEDRR